MFGRIVQYASGKDSKDRMANDGMMCPGCGSTKDVNTKLRVMFTTCCGAPTCTDCIDSKFLSKKVIECTGCSQSLTTKDYSSENLDSQCYNRENKVRREFSTTFNMTRANFPSKAMYDEYLEMAADCVYEATYGTNESKREVIERVNKWQQEHKDAILNNTAKQVKEEAKLEAKRQEATRQRDGDGDADADKGEDGEDADAEMNPFQSRARGWQVSFVPQIEGESNVVNRGEPDEEKRFNTRMQNRNANEKREWETLTSREAQVEWINKLEWRKELERSACGWKNEWHATRCVESASSFCFLAHDSAMQDVGSSEGAAVGQEGLAKVKNLTSVKMEDEGAIRVKQEGP